MHYFMKKTLADLSPEDWGRLFPIQLQEHKENWKTIFNTEARLLQKHIKYIERIEHFGSTAIPAIKAKPYIDMLVQIPEQWLFSKQLIEAFTQEGYYYSDQQDKASACMILVKGYKADGYADQVFHIHACAKGHKKWEQLKFRDYLLKHPKRAKAYEELKVNLAQQHQFKRAAYRIAKTAFITETIALYEQSKDQ